MIFLLYRLDQKPDSTLFPFLCLSLLSLFLCSQIHQNFLALTESKYFYVVLVTWEHYKILYCLTKKCFLNNSCFVVAGYILRVLTVANKINEYNFILCCKAACFLSNKCVGHKLKGFWYHGIIIVLKLCSMISLDLQFEIIVKELI